MDIILTSSGPLRVFLVLEGKLSWTSHSLHQVPSVSSLCLRASFHGHHAHFIRSPQCLPCACGQAFMDITLTSSGPLRVFLVLEGKLSWTSRSLHQVPSESSLCLRASFHGHHAHFIRSPQSSLCLRASFHGHHAHFIRSPQSLPCA